MDIEVIGLLAVVGLLVLMFLRVPIAMALLISGTLGYAASQGWGVALRTLASVPYELTGANPGVAYSFTVVPLFIFMGAVASRANMSSELFDAANAVFSGVRGALAAATIGSCAAFSAICGSSIATAATFSKVEKLRINNAMKELSNVTILKKTFKLNTYFQFKMTI